MHYWFSTKVQKIHNLNGLKVQIKNIEKEIAILRKLVDLNL